MTVRSLVRFVLFTACAGAAAGCSRSQPTALWPPVIDPVVFTDTFGSHVGWQAFGNSKLDALALDATEAHSGTSSLKFTVPAPGDPSGGYAGGALVTTQARSLTPYNALSFWVKASRAVSLETVGFGNNNKGTSLYEAKRAAIPMTTAWTRVLVPIPQPERLDAEEGMLFVAEPPQAGTGLTFWIDDVQFVDDASITNPRPNMNTQTLNAIVGSNVSLQGTTRTVFGIGGFDQTVTHMPAYFTFATTNASVASVIDGQLHVAGAGSATITAKLGTIDATGTLTVNAIAPPIAAAPTPAVPASDVVSLFSNAYTNVPVDSWQKFGTAGITVQDLAIAGNTTKLYSSLNLGYVGAEFQTHAIDATTMTTFHMDVWVTSGTTLRVKLVDFGADGVFGGGNDSQHELTFDASSTPALTTGTWIGLEIPLTDFTGLASRAHLAQLILSGDTPIVFVDNVYFHK